MILFSASTVFGDTPAFPGALGFGANATGGRTGTVYHVTTLADSGPGSFRDAVSSANRVIVFDVGGYISLSSAISAKGNLTIAGQTAPGGGIGFKGGEISFASRSNIICRHIRIVPGSTTASTDDDALSLYRAQNAIFDHVSFEFAPYDNIDGVSDDWQTYPVNNFTFQNCLNADPIGQQFGAHMEAVNGNMSWFYSIFANSHNRNPLAKMNDVFVNNVLYNCSAGYTTHTSTQFSHDIVNNYFIAGPAYSSSEDFPWYQVDDNQSIYYSGNLFDSDEDNTLNGSTTTPYWYQGGTGTILSSPWSSITTNIPTYSTATAYRIAVSQAGTFPRDQMDDLIINQVKTLGSGTTGYTNGTTGPDGGFYTSQSQTGLGNSGYGTISSGIASVDSDGDGMPDYWELANGLSITANDAMTIASDGYANIEHYINWLADPHALTSTNTAVDVDLWQYTSGFTNASPVYTVFNASNGVVTLDSDSHTAHFVPATNYHGIGSFQFGVTTSDSVWSNTVAVVVTPESLANTAPSYLTWIGDGVTNLWSGTNWWDGTNLVTFTAGDTVTFDDTGSDTPAINITSAVSAGTIYVEADQDYTFIGNGILGGTVALYKNGAGQLNIYNTNTFSGGTVINEGVVQVGDGTSYTGSLIGSITNNDTLIYNNPTALSVSASLAGYGTFYKNGAGALTLSGTHTCTGPISVNAGMLTLSGTLPPCDITNNSILYLKASSSQVYANSISGSGSVTVNTSGVLSLAGTNTFTGNITNISGFLVLSNSQAAGSGSVNYTNGYVVVASGVVITNDFQVLGNASVDLCMMASNSGTATWTGNVYVGGSSQWRPGSDGGTLVFTGTASQGSHIFLIPRGSVQIASNAVITSTSSGWFGRDSSANKRSLNLTIRDNASVSMASCDMGGGKAGGSVTVTLQNNASVSFGSGSLELHDIANAAAVSSLRLNGGTLTAGGFTKAKTSYTNMICFNGGTLKAGASSASFLPVFSVSTNIVQSGGAIIDDGGYAITIAAPLLHDPSLGSTLDGGLTKLGAGTLTLSGVSLYTGPTTIKAGTLALALASASTIANTTNIYIAAGAVLDTTTAGGFSLGSGRTLWGNGSVNGAFTINSGALLAPGSNAIGTLTFNNALTLAAGSTNIFEISHALQTNDLAVVSGALTCGGTLIVTNLSGALAAGDSFKLFNAGSYNGAFANVILPPLNSGLGWNTNALAISGVIAVVSAAPPVISSVNWSATGFGFSGTGGVAGVTFYVLASTNVAAPVTNWTPLLTNQFGTDGSFNFTNDPGTNAQNFYRLQLQ